MYDSGIIAYPYKINSDKIDSENHEHFVESYFETEMQVAVSR